MCPPGVDQTARIRQEWHFIAPLLKEQYDLTDSHTNVTSMLDEGSTTDAFDKLAVRTPADAENLETVLSKLSRANDAAEDSPLETLPNELLAMILNDEYLNASDIVALGLCSSILWRQCLNHVRTTVLRGPWANTPLICTGRYLDSLPSTIHELIPSMREEEEEKWRRWNWNEIYTYTNVVETWEAKWLEAFATAVFTPHVGIQRAEQTILLQSLIRALSPYKPNANCKYVLRNHTTHQCLAFQSASHAASAEEQVLQLKGLPAYTLDQALMTLTLWTDGLTLRPAAAAAGISVGRWVGCSFDVDEVGGENVVAELKGWEDVMEQMGAGVEGSGGGGALMILWECCNVVCKRVVFILRRLCRTERGRFWCGKDDDVSNHLFIFPNHEQGH